MPQIVKPDVFDKVQTIMEARKKNTRLVSGSKYLLSGFVRCCECRHSMVIYTSFLKSRTYSSSYRCNNKKVDASSTRSIRISALEIFIINTLKRILRADGINELFDNIKIKSFSEKQKINDELSRLENNLIELNGDKNRLKRIKSTSKNTSHQFISKEIRDIEIKTDSTKKEILRLNQKLVDYTNIKKNDLSNSLATLRKDIYEGSQELIRKVIERFMNKIVISNTKIDIYFNLARLLSKDTEVYFEYHISESRANIVSVLKTRRGGV